MQAVFVARGYVYIAPGSVRAAVECEAECTWYGLQSCKAVQAPVELTSLSKQVGGKHLLVNSGLQDFSLQAWHRIALLKSCISSISICFVQGILKQVAIQSMTVPDVHVLVLAQWEGLHTLPRNLPLSAWTTSSRVFASVSRCNVKREIL